MVSTQILKLLYIWKDSFGRNFGGYTIFILNGKNYMIQYLKLIAKYKTIAHWQFDI